MTPEEFFFMKDPSNGNNVLLEDYGDRIEIRHDLGKGFDDTAVRAISHKDLEQFLSENGLFYWPSKPLLVASKQILFNRVIGEGTTWM